MKAYVFPGQGAQFEGMGKELLDRIPLASKYFDQAKEVLGFDILEVMSEGSAEDLKQTKVTQPAIFLHSVIPCLEAGSSFIPDAVAGHSLGEFSALVANSCLTFEEGLKLVSKRAMAMQKACEKVETTMAAVLGLEDDQVERICAEIEGTVVPANYNCPGQLVISGSIEGIQTAVSKLQDAGARRAIVLSVGGAFHSPFMEPAKVELQEAIDHTIFKVPICPIYQNVDGEKTSSPEVIKDKLIKQLISPVKWTHSIHNMIRDGVVQFIEAGGNGKVLRGLIRKINRDVETVVMQ